MESYHIRGGNPICGEMECAGAKNAALPILAATILAKGENLITNCPEISDVENMLCILRELGCSAVRDGDKVYVDSTGLNCYNIPSRLMKGMRSSVFLMGPMIGRCKKVILSRPGGCEIGQRPIDIHLSALGKLGVNILQNYEELVCTADKLVGTELVLDFPSVGATENLMLAALAAEGETVIRNCAREPEIVDLQIFLNKCGGAVNGAGTDTIVIKGDQPLTGAEHKIIPDRIECGTFLAAAAATGGELLLENVRRDHLEIFLRKLEDAGCSIKSEPDRIHLMAPKRLKALKFVATEPYPGFPTDLQSQLLMIMTTAAGRSCIREEIFESRFKQVPELIKMGADIEILGRSAIINGVPKLCGAEVSAGDLRGGAALVLAGLCAEGETVVKYISHIERGYAAFHKKLRNLGADIDLE